MPFRVISFTEGYQIAFSDMVIEQCDSNDEGNEASTIFLLLFYRFGEHAFCTTTLGEHQVAWASLQQEHCGQSGLFLGFLLAFFAPVDSLASKFFLNRFLDKGRDRYYSFGNQPNPGSSLGKRKPFLNVTAFFEGSPASSR